MREDLHEDPAVLEIAHKLGTRPEHVVGYCHRFWSWASRNLVLNLSPEIGDRCPDSVPNYQGQMSGFCPDSVLRGVPIESIEAVLNLPGFLRYLCEVGWLRYANDEASGPVLTVPNFDRWLSQGAKSRVVASQKKRQQRSEKHVPILSRKCPSKTGTREEKRREHKNKPPFIPPCVADVRAYCNERSNGVDPVKFVNFYQSKGWKVGKNKMEDWQAAVRTWERNEGPGFQHATAAELLGLEGVE
jgi:hypothetical protein